MVTLGSKVKRIWGQQFRIVKNGLDEADVSAFVSRLVEQNNELLSKLEHVDSLKKLAQKAVIEAAKLAERVKIEADDKAKAIISQAEEEARIEAARTVTEAERNALDRISASEELAQDMINGAEEKAKAYAGDIITEAEEKARAEADRIVAEAQQRLEESTQEAVVLAEQQAQDIIKAAEEKAEAIKAPAKEEGDSILAEAKQKSEAAELKAQEMMIEVAEKAESIKALAEEEASRIVAEAEQKAEHLAEAWAAKAEDEGRGIIEAATKRAAIEAQRTKQVVEETRLRSNNLEEGQLSEKFDRLCDLLLSGAAGAGLMMAQGDGNGKNGPALYHGTVEVDILPPVASDRVMKLHKYLSKTPQIRILDLQGSAGSGIRFKLFLRTDMPLLDMLKALPEVEKVSDGTKQADRSHLPQHRKGEPAVSRIVVTPNK